MTTIEKHNVIVVSDFLSMHGNKTKEIYTKFLFEMLALFTEKMAHCDDQYTQDCVGNISLLNDLILNLKNPHEE